MTRRKSFLSADDMLTREYKGPEGARAVCLLPILKRSVPGKSPHSPKNCLPGSGFQPSKAGESTCR